MKFYSWRFYMAVTLVISSAHAEEISYKYSGVHFDATSEQYFVNDQPKFNIQPLGGTKFLDRIEYSIDDVGFSPYENGIHFAQEGLHTLRFKAVDPVNNWSPIQSFRIFADLTKPVSQMNWFGQMYVINGKNFVAPTAKLVITANDNLSGISRILWKKGSGKISEYKTPQSFDKAGDYTFEFMAIDNVGNMEPWQTYSFTVDRAHPESNIALKGDSHKKKDRVYTKYGSLLELVSTDTGAGIKNIEMKINGGETLIYDRPVALDKKMTRVKFRGIDHVGNVEKWQSYEVYVDTEAPGLKVNKIGKHHIMGGKIFAKTGFKLEVKAFDKDAGIKSISLNGQEKQGVDKEALTFDKEGTFDVSMTAYDNVGNKATPQNMIVVIDNTPPTSTHSTDLAMVEREGILYSSIPNKLSIKSDDGGVGVDRIEISYDGKNYHKLTGDIDFATWKSQQRTLHYRAKDHLGNVESYKKVTIAIRDKGPAVGLFVETDELGNIPISQLKNKKGRKMAGDK